MATPVQVEELELGLLRTFLLVVRYGSIRKAATDIEMTQPAVSQQMLRLEKIVGQKLLNRGRDGVTVTSHGQMLVTYANRMVALSEETLAMLREAGAPARVVIGRTGDVAIGDLIPAFKRSQSIYPNLEIKSVVATTHQLESLLENGGLDLVVANSKAMNNVPMTTWTVELQWASRKNLQVEKALPLPLVLFEKPCAWQDEMLEVLSQAGWQWRVAFESSSLDAILTATQSGLGIAALPPEPIREFKLATLLGAGLPAAPKVELGVFAGPALLPHARTVLDIINASILSNRE